MARSQKDESLEFRRYLRRYSLKFEGDIDAAIIRMAIKMGENIVVGGDFSPGTPVDEGIARGSWYPALNGKPVGQSFGSISKTGVVTMAAVEAGWRKGKAGDTFEVWTNTVYMPALEYGHSKQAPRGMVRLTMRAGQLIADQVVREMKSRG